MLKAILMGIVVMILTVLMDRSLMGENFIEEVEDENGEKSKKFNVAGFDDPDTWTRAIGYGALVGFVSFAITAWGSSWLIGVACLLAMMALMLQYAWWWGFACKKGAEGKLKALIWLLLIQWAISAVAAQAVRNLLGFDLISGSKFWTFVVDKSPVAIGTLCNGSAIVGVCRRYGKNILATIFTWLTVLCIVLMIIGGITGGIHMNTTKTQVTEPKATQEVVAPIATPAVVVTPQPTVTPAPVSSGQQQNKTQQNQQVVWYKFYNLLIQNDGLNNDNDFGPNPCKESWGTLDYANDMVVRIKNDPVLGAADIAYFDHIAGTNISGVKYDSDPDKWLSAINARAVEFVKDQNLYNKVVEEFIRAINNPNLVQNIGVKLYKDINGLMYMDPNNSVNVGGIGCSNVIKMPKVIWKSHNEQAYFLVFTIKKGNSSSTTEAIYKLACGYQPPLEKSGSGGINPGGNNNPGPGPNPPYFEKDPTKGTDVGKNDTTGPGPNTNNGKGAQTSKVDTPDSSSSMTYPEYREPVQEKATVNENQKVGGDPNTPTTQTPSGTVVQGNADKSTGNGGIDTHTKVEGFVQTDGGVAVGGQTEAHIEMPD